MAVLRRPLLSFRAHRLVTAQGIAGECLLLAGCSPPIAAMRPFRPDPDATSDGRFDVVQRAMSDDLEVVLGIALPVCKTLPLFAVRWLRVGLRFLKVGAKPKCRVPGQPQST